jgi:hypothetical protein
MLDPKEEFVFIIKIYLQDVNTYTSESRLIHVVLRAVKLISLLQHWVNCTHGREPHIR